MRGLCHLVGQLQSYHMTLTGPCHPVRASEIKGHTYTYIHITAALPNLTTFLSRNAPLENGLYNWLLLLCGVYYTHIILVERYGTETDWLL